MEPLIEIPQDKWRDLCNLYRSDWPVGAPIHCMLDFLLTFSGLAQEFNFHIYCPEGILTNGIVATSLMDGSYEVIIQPIDGKVEKIEAALVSTKIIDWDKTVVVPFACSSTIECLERVKNYLKINLFYNAQTKAYVHFLDKSSAKLVELTTSSNTYIGTLRPEHIGIVDRTWTYHSKHSYKGFEMLMNYNLAYVLYSKSASKPVDTEKEKEENYELEKKLSETSEENKSVSDVGQTEAGKYLEVDDKSVKDGKADSEQPLAWLSVNKHGALQHLFCPEKLRGKGYGEAITRYVVNELLSKGHSLSAYTLENNMIPKNIFKKLGFEDLGHVFWVIVTKQTNDD